MADTKQLVLVVEGTPTMRRYWSTILYDYLFKIIKSFCGDDDDTVATNDNVELGLVVFNANESSLADMSQRYGLTSDRKVLIDWLSFINFDIGNRGFNTTIADGLNAAFMLYDSTNVSRKWHCILVAASNPNPLVSQQSDKSKTAAKTFSECGVSLSIICPEQYPILKEIYNAGKGNVSATDHTIAINEYPQYLVLISEKLVKDCVNLSQSGIITVLQNPSAAQDPVNLEPVPEHVQGPSTQTYEHVPFGYTNTSVLNRLSQVRLDFSTGISTIGGMSVGGYSHGNNEARQSIPETETGTMMLIPPPPPLLMPYNQVQSQSPVVKVWEGDLSCLNNSRPVLMARLQAYKISTSSKLIGADWPTTMVIESLKLQDEINNTGFDVLVFRATEDHGLYRHLKDTNRCALIRLPREILLLVPALVQPNKFTGMLFPLDGFVFKSQTFMHHQPPSQQQQQQGRFFP